MTKSIDNQFPLVSVVITSYGDVGCLASAITSVINQTYKHIEIIIVDDNGIDSPYSTLTKEIVSGFEDISKIKFYQHRKNMNGAAARNTGIKHAIGKYITFLDNDDFMLPSRIQNAVTFLESNIHNDAVFCGVGIREYKYYVGITLPLFSDMASTELLINERAMGTGSNLFLTMKSACSLNGFDTTFVRNQDVEFMLRFFRKFKSGSIDSIDLIKGSNLTSNVPNYNTLLDVKKRLNCKFSDEIDKMSYADKKNYFDSLHIEFCRTALLSGNHANIRSALFHAKQNHVKLPLIKCVYWFFKGMYPKFTSILLWPYVFIRNKHCLHILLKSQEFRVYYNHSKL